MHKHKKESYKQASQIARQLKETQGSATGLIRRLITELGFDKVKSWADQAVEAQANGGMWIEHEERKRSTGGIFFYILKQEISPEMRKALFGSGKQKKKLGATPPTPSDTEAQIDSADKPTSNVNVEHPAGDAPVATIDKPTPLTQETSKLDQLQLAAETLRERIATLEAEGKKGIKMTKLLLANTEKQIEQLTS